MLLSALPHGMAPNMETQCPREKAPNKQLGLGTEQPQALLWAAQQPWVCSWNWATGVCPQWESRMLGHLSGLPLALPTCPSRVHGRLPSCPLPEKHPFIPGLGIYRRASGGGKGPQVPPST